MASSKQGNEFPAAFIEVPFCVRTPSPRELRNRNIDRSLAKHLAVVIQVPTLHAVVLVLIDCLLLFTVVVHDALWLASTGASRVDFRVWLEECPKQIVGDFIIPQKREKADEVDQEVHVLEGRKVV